jgi:transposase
MSAQGYRVWPLSSEWQRIKAFFPEEAILECARPYDDLAMGRPSEDPIILTKVLLLSFLYAVAGEEKTLATLTSRMAWRQCCDLPLDAPIPDRSTLVKFRRRGGWSVLEGVFRRFLDLLVDRDLLDLVHRFFEGTPVKARASLNPYRDAVDTEVLAAIDEKLKHFHSQQGERDPCLNPTPVALTKATYPGDNAAGDARRAQAMKPVVARQSAGDPEARFQRGNHGNRRELVDDGFFSTDGKPVFIEDGHVMAEAAQGQQVFVDKLEQRPEGQTWSVDAEFAQGAILDQAEANGVTLNTPPRQVPFQGRFPTTEFGDDAEADPSTGPPGQIVSPRGTNRQNGERHDRPAPGRCAACPLREQCPTAKTGRTVTRNRDDAHWERQREHPRTPEAVRGKVLRGIIAEGKFAAAVRPGLKTMRSGGKQMANLQSKLVAFILKVKRFLRLEAQGIVT